eukprot:6186112-Pleurochrysis_carterae.AAC.12
MRAAYQTLKSPTSACTSKRAPLKSCPRPCVAAYKRHKCGYIAAPRRCPKQSQLSTDTCLRELTSVLLFSMASPATLQSRFSGRAAGSETFQVNRRPNSVKKRRWQRVKNEGRPIQAGFADPIQRPPRSNLLPEARHDAACIASSPPSKPIDARERFSLAQIGEMQVNKCTPRRE